METWIIFRIQRWFWSWKAPQTNKRPIKASTWHTKESKSSLQLQQQASYTVVSIHNISHFKRKEYCRKRNASSGVRLKPLRRPRIKPESTIHERIINIDSYEERSEIYNHAPWDLKKLSDDSVDDLDEGFSSTFSSSEVRKSKEGDFGLTNSIMFQKLTSSKNREFQHPDLKAKVTKKNHPLYKKNISNVS